MILSQSHVVRHPTRTLKLSQSSGVLVVVQNLIQFQHGMSLPEFLQCFGTEAACIQALVRARRTNGYRCARYVDHSHCVVRYGSRSHFQCNGCRHQASATAGSIFASTKLPLTTWFLAICLISRAKTGLSGLALKSQIGVSYPTAWMVHHKIMISMANREDVYKLGGSVQIDDAYLGGKRTGGKSGRGAENKVPIVAAVALNEAGNPVYAKLSAVSTFSRSAIAAWAKSNLKPGADVNSDGLGCFPAVTDAGCTHRVEVVGTRKPRELPQFRWVNTILGDLKTILSGAHKSFGFVKYARRYLGALTGR